MPETDRDQRILVYIPGGKDADIACNVLRAAQMEGVACRSAEDLFKEMDNGAGAVLLVNEVLVPHFVAKLVHFLGRQPAWSDLPILVANYPRAGTHIPDHPLRALGNLFLLDRPIRMAALVGASASALRARRRQYDAREAERRKDEFLASLGHELRNPLAPIRTAASILAHLYPNSPEVGRICEVVERQVSHLTRLIDDLLDVARITRGKVVLQFAPTTLFAVIDHALEMCAAPADKAGHRIDVSRPAEDIPLVADRARLVQSVANVVANAIKFTPHPGKISLAAGAHAGKVVIRVKDSGRGLETHALDKIFELFTQMDAGQGEVKEGLGIGLSLAKQFLQMHGGSIQAYSEGLGRGSEFVITLPVDATVSPAQQSSLPFQPGATQPLPTTVLVVDDNRDAADMLLSLFRANGFVAFSAYDGEQALQETLRLRPDVLVMDLGMPGLDGYEVARRIRNDYGKRPITMIALTGWGEEKTRKRALEAGFDFHVIKPVDIEVLKGHIAQTGLKREAPPA